MTRLKAVNAVDPMEHIGEILWCVYGVECAPSIICCKLDKTTGVVTIWGYSVYKGVPGFRTLGLDLSVWRHFHIDRGWYLEKWFLSNDDALAFLKKLIEPKI